MEKSGSLNYAVVFQFGVGSGHYLIILSFLRNNKNADSLIFTAKKKKRFHLILNMTSNIDFLSVSVNIGVPSPTGADCLFPVCVLMEIESAGESSACVCALL